MAASQKWRDKKFPRKTPLPEFSRASAIAAGLSLYFTGVACANGHIAGRRVSNWKCIECERERSQNMREHRNELARKNWPKVREKRSAENKIWKADNHARMTATMAAYRAAHPGREKLWDQDKRRAAKVRSEAKRRARKLNCEIVATTDEIEALLIRQKHRCGWCGVSIKKSRELDHIKPLSKGGSHAAANLLWSCRPCNRTKRDKDPITWAQSLGKLI